MPGIGNNWGVSCLTSDIRIDPSICHGKPCIRGLCYSVENILEWLASGMSIEEILADYEDLERAAILAVLDGLKPFEKGHSWVL